MFENMKLELEPLDLPDIEPLAIWKVGDTTKKPMWVNPHIKTWFMPDEDGIDYSHHTLHASNNEGLHMVILFKSDWLNDRYDKLLNDIDSGVAYPSNVYDTEYVDLEKIDNCLKSTLTDDFYIPGPKIDATFTTTKDYVKFREECSKVHSQFCFTPVGIKFEKLYQKTYNINIACLSTITFVKDKLIVNYHY